MINGKLEEPTIGVGFVGRERRSKFIKSWFNLFYLEPLTKGALYHCYPMNWSLFKYTTSGYIYVNSYETKPDNQLINELLT